MTLDFSQLTDDQLVDLIAAALEEVTRRETEVLVAARGAALEEAEKAEIARLSAERERAKILAEERVRVAQQAAARVRAEAEARASESRRASTQQAATDAAERERKLLDQQRAWIKRAAELVEKPVAEISLCSVVTRYGWRVLINPGCDRYERTHFADYNLKDKQLKTVKRLIPKKPEVAAFCVEFAEWDRAQNKSSATFLCGKDFDNNGSAH